MSDELRTRNRILNKARDHFFKHGFTKVTLDEIVQEMGVSKKTIYKFFPSKTEILRELLNLKLQEVEDGLAVHVDHYLMTSRLKLSGIGVTQW